MENLGDEGAGTEGNMGGEGSSGSLNPQVRSTSAATGGAVHPQPSNAGQFAAEVAESLVSFAAAHHADFVSDHGKHALEKLKVIERGLALSTAERISNKLAVAAAAVSEPQCI